MITLLEKQIKCRKEHLCIWCGEKIKKNEDAYFYKYKYEDKIMNDYYHNECQEAMLEFHKEYPYEEDFNAYNFMRGGIESK